MSIQQPNTHRQTTPVIIDLAPVPPPRAAEPSSTGSVRPEVTAQRGDDFDVLRLPPARYDRWDRLYRNVFLVLFAVAMVAGFWFRH
ncbi:MAG: hypothetical protein K2X45_11010 [Phreatobacter sp.]|nr:hypothetical protein [Phreatobacter sp.]